MFKNRIAFLSLWFLLHTSLPMMAGIKWPVQKVREAVTRAKCANNLKQIGLACHDYREQSPGPGCLGEIAPGIYNVVILSQQTPDSAPGTFGPLIVLNNLVTLNFSRAGTVTGPLTNTNGTWTTVFSGDTFGGTAPFKGPTTFTALAPGILSGAQVNGTFNVNGMPETYNYTLGFNPIAVFPTIGCTDTFRTADPVSLATGELVSDYVPDFALGGPLALEFRRYYASFLVANAVTSSLGDNWMHNFDQKLGVSGSSASVILFRGGRVRFQQTGGAWQPVAPPRLAYQLLNASDGYRFLDPAENLIYTFSTAGSLTKIEDRNGNALAVTASPSGPTQVSDGLGRSLNFSYASGSLVKIQDQSNRSVSFAHSGNNLTGVTDANGNTANFSYTSASGVPALMTKGVRPGGNSPYTQGYDGFARVSQQTDSFSNKTSFAYNSGGSDGSTVMTDPLSRTFGTTHPNRFDIATYTDAAGQSGSVSYDAARRPVSITDRLGNKTSVTYDQASGYPASIIDALGNSTVFSYVAQTQAGFTFYNLTKIGYADGTSATFTYDASGNVLAVADRAGKITTFTYNSRGQVLTAANATGGTTTYAYNADATLATVKSPAGNVTSFGYDAAKRISQVKFGDGTSNAFSYDAADRLIKLTDELGKALAFTYDSNDHVQSVTDQAGNTSSTAYDTDDLVTSVTNALSKITRFQYDPFGSITSATDAVGEKFSYTYDSLNRRSSEADGAGKKTSFTYDAEGRLATVTDPLSNVVGLAVDKLGNTVQVSTPANEKYLFSYDKLSQLVSITNPLSLTSTITYEKRGLVSGITLPTGVAGSFSWSDLGTLATIMDPNGNVWTGAYDNMGRLISKTDPLSQTVSLTYDGRDRLAGVTSGVGKVAITRDAAGHETQRQYSDGTSINLTYDDVGRITGGDGLSIRYDATGRIVNSNGIVIGRDDIGRIASIAYTPDKAITYSYDPARGLLTQIADWTGAVTTLTYDDAGQLLSVNRGNGVTTQVSYDKDHRVASIVDSGSNPIDSITLQRDGDGKVVSAARSLPQSPALASGLLPLGYDAANQIVGSTYDSLGRLVNDGLRTYAWDMATRLVSYQGADGSASFGYDALRMKTSRTGADGTTLNYVLNYALDLPSIGVVQSGGSDVRYYIHFPDGSLLYSIEAADNTHRYFHFDETGSTMALTDDSGVVTDAYGITPYGETVTQTGTSANPFTYLGKWGIEQEPGTTLFYMRNRYYDSAMARFLSRDPVLSLDPRALNPYQYVLANPLSNVDPLGLKTQQYIQSFYLHQLHRQPCQSGWGNRNCPDPDGAWVSPTATEWPQGLLGAQQSDQLWNTNPPSGYSLISPSSDPYNNFQWAPRSQSWVKSADQPNLPVFFLPSPSSSVQPQSKQSWTTPAGVQPNQFAPSLLLPTQTNTWTNGQSLLSPSLTGPAGTSLLPTLSPFILSPTIFATDSSQ